jgi:hypothetical protein
MWLLAWVEQVREFKAFRRNSDTGLRPPVDSHPPSISTGPRSGTRRVDTLGGIEERGREGAEPVTCGPRLLRVRVGGCDHEWLTPRPACPVGGYGRRSAPNFVAAPLLTEESLSTQRSRLRSAGLLQERPNSIGHSIPPPPTTLPPATQVLQHPTPTP